MDRNKNKQTNIPNKTKQNKQTKTKIKERKKERKPETRITKL